MEMASELAVKIVSTNTLCGACVVLLACSLCTHVHGLVLAIIAGRDIVNLVYSSLVPRQFVGEINVVN